MDHIGFSYLKPHRDLRNYNSEYKEHVFWSSLLHSISVIFVNRYFYVNVSNVFHAQKYIYSTGV